MEVLPPLGVLKPEDKHFIKFAYFDAVNSAKENSFKKSFCYCKRRQCKTQRWFNVVGVTRGAV